LFIRIRFRFTRFCLV